MSAQAPSNFRKWIFVTGAIALFIGLGVFLHACENRGVEKERQVMEVTQTNAMPNVAIPPIDRFAPLKTETATFALG
jgi:hypothetical protein